MYQDDCRLKGVVNLVLRDKDGKVKQHKTIRNKVTRQGVAHIIGRMIDDSQDKHGNHQMPRMMSHMAIGIGAAARDNFNSYTAKDFNDLSTSGAGYSAGVTGTALTQRKRAADSSVHDRRLQDERGQRVQLMKDTTKSTDYVTLENVRLEQSGSTAIHQVSNNKSIFIFETGSDSGNSLEKLRVGLKISRIHTSAMSGDPRSGTAPTNSGPILTIEKIESGSSTTSPSITSSETKVTLSGTIAPVGAQPAAGSGDVYIDVDYVNAKTLTTYTNTNPHPTHSTTLESVLQGTTGGFGLGPFNNRTSRRGSTDSAFFEGGIGWLGINRGQIGAFYEREITYNMNLKNTDQDGVANNPANRTFSQTTLDEAGYAKLDGSAGSYVARFPFIGAAEDKPAGKAATFSGNTAGADSPNDADRGTEFIQFGTAVDGIFQGELVGSSIVEDPSNTIPEGYPPTENDYGQIGGLHVTNAGSLTQRAQYATGSTAALNYNTNASYAPNAIAGAKRNGDRVVYVATFKENNPRPEIDYDFFTAAPTTGNVGRGREPTNRIYPITEAGIFNKHIEDLGIFDVGNLTYTNDQTATDIAHVDRRGDSNTFTGTIPLSGASATSHGEVDGVLTTGGARVKASALGFTQGPITQSMLCRTTFDPVNKATADTLQITWSVQLQDATTS